MSKLTDAIKLAAGTSMFDDVIIFTGQVIDTQYAYSDGVISVKQITGQVASEVEQVDPKLSINQKTNYDLTKLVNESLGDVIFENVSLQASPGEAMFMIPAIGSHVTVCYSKYQDPFILTVQDITSLINYIGETYIIQNQTNVAVGYKNNYLISTTDLIELDADSGKKINLIVNSGSSIILNDKILIQNASTTLKIILTNLNSQLLNTVNLVESVNLAIAAAFATGSFAAAASAYAASATTITTNVTRITTNITNITTLINSLLN